MDGRFISARYGPAEPLKVGEKNNPCSTGSKLFRRPGTICRLGPKAGATFNLFIGTACSCVGPVSSVPCSRNEEVPSRLKMKRTEVSWGGWCPPQAQLLACPEKRSGPSKKQPEGDDKSVVPIFIGDSVQRIQFQCRTKNHNLSHLPTDRRLLNASWLSLPLKLPLQSLFLATIRRGPRRFHPYSFQIESIKIHNLIPGGNKILNELLLAVVAGIDFGHSSQL